MVEVLRHFTFTYMCIYGTCGHIYKSLLFPNKPLNFAKFVCHIFLSLTVPILRYHTYFYKFMTVIIPKYIYNGIV